MDTQRIQTALKDSPEFAARAADALASVLARSASDPDFRQRLLSNPHQAISEVTGKPVPADYRVTFIENKADATLVLPDPVAPQAELNESELQTVSGGLTPGVVASIAAWGGVVAGGAWLISEIIEIVGD